MSCLNVYHCTNINQRFATHKLWATLMTIICYNGVNVTLAMTCRTHIIVNHRYVVWMLQTYKTIETVRYVIDLACNFPIRPPVRVTYFRIKYICSNPFELQ